MIKRLLLLALTLSFSLCARAQSTIDGYWELQVPNGGVSFFYFEQSGETVESADGRLGAAFVGTLQGNKLHLVANIKYKGEPFTLILDGTRQSSDQFEATEVTPGVTAHQVFDTQGVLRRVDRDAAYPARLSLPSLEDQP